MDLTADAARARRASLSALGAILVVAAVLRYAGLAFGLPNTEARPDEETTVTVAVGMLFMSLNPRFFDWPSLEFYVLAALYRVAWEVGRLRGVFQHKYEMASAAAAHPAAFFLTPRVIAASAGVVTVWFVYRAARIACDELTALVAAFLTAVAFLHVRDSHFGVTDVPMTCLLVASLIPLLRAWRAPAERRYWTRAGLLAGLTASTKYGGGLIAAAAVAIALLAAFDRRTAAAARDRRRIAIGGLFRYAVAAALAFVAGTPFAVIDFPRFLAALRFDRHHLEAGHGIVVGAGWIRHLTFSLPGGLGSPMFAAALAGMIVLAVRSWRAAVAICTFPVVYFVMTSRGQTVFVRYMTPLVPFLCVTAAVAIVAAARAIGGSARTVAVTASAFALIAAVPSLRRDVALDRLLRERDTRVLAAEWLDARRDPSDWIDEETTVSIYPPYGRPAGLKLSRFDAGRFRSEQGETVSPDWIVVGESPLTVYTTMPEGVRPILEASYDLAMTFSPVTSPEPASFFDQQDKLFVPYTDFSRRLRPGPTVRIFRRRP